ncbi:serine/threonine-protein kinase [Nocardia sp. BMG111209]|uniref:serine/threonine-protein kinase n=1 Tax=Nocardia sp. BMG111209 TaxID=1160137 RepID=UPI00037EFAF1|nr:serine/threonine-protein kinase [Nocardia sp. BMG111209]
MAELAKGDRFAGYLIENVLGRGGMGTVYLARHPRLPQWVALKLLAREVSSDAELRRRFLREADVVAQLDHPGIVTVSDRGDDNDHLWIAMQYVHGSDAARLDARTVAVERAVRIVADAAAALDYAHSRNILHRDVKPANILLTEPDIGRKERAVLTDFGIARLVGADTHLTATGTFLATLAFASPEQLSGEPVDHRSDQYSLACTLYALLAGASPFAATSPGQVVAGHLTRPLPRLQQSRGDVPDRVDAILARATAKSASERFDSCGEFASGLVDSLRNARTVATATPTLGGSLFRTPVPSAHAARSAVGSQPQATPPPVGHSISASIGARRRIRSRVPVVVAVLSALALAAVATVVAVRHFGSDDSGLAVRATVPIGNSPSRMVATSSDVYVLADDGKSIWTVDVATGTVSGIRRFDMWINSIAAENGVYVSTTMKDNGGAVLAIDPEQGTVRARIPVGQEIVDDMAFDALDRHLYALSADAGGGSANVNVIDTAANVVTGRIPLDQDAGMMVGDPTSHNVFVGTHAHGNVHVTDEISVVDGSTGSVVKKIPIGEDILAMVYSPDAEALYALKSTPASVSADPLKAMPSKLLVIDIHSGSIVNTIDSGTGGSDIAFDRKRHRLYVANTDAADPRVTVIDTAANKVVASVRTPAMPTTTTRAGVEQAVAKPGAVAVEPIEGTVYALSRNSADWNSGLLWKIS